MRRKPSDTDIVQVNLRITRAKKAALEKAAEGKRSLNAEMVWRIDSTFEQPVMLQADQLAENVVRLLGPLVGDIHELNVSGDYRRTVGKLMTLVRPLLATGVIAGRTGETIRTVMNEIDKADSRAEQELGRRLQQMHTTGERP